MSDIAPLVPPEVDLRDFPFLPLDVVRLRDSGLTAKATGDEFRAAVLLWCASWHQQPAASLPNDDDELANLCGYGRAMREWTKIRKGALRGWIECSDGRLYHPTVAVKANDAWQSKQAQRARTEAARRAREEARQRQSQALSQRKESTVTDTATESKGQGQGQGQGIGREIQPPTPDGVAPPSPPDPEPAARAKAPAKSSPTVKRPDGVTEQVWADWLALRRAKRAPVTQTVVDGAEREAAKAGMSLEAFLAVWCRRGSQGLEAAWLKPEERIVAAPGDRKSRQLEGAAILTGAGRVAPAFLQPQQPLEAFDVEPRVIAS